MLLLSDNKWGFADWSDEEIEICGLWWVLPDPLWTNPANIMKRKGGNGIIEGIPAIVPSSGRRK